MVFLGEGGRLECSTSVRVLVLQDCADLSVALLGGGRVLGLGSVVFCQGFRSWVKGLGVRLL